MKDAVLNYLLIILAILVTLLLIMAVAACMKFTWDEFIYPIIKQARDKKYDYWQKRYEESETKYRKLSFGISNLGLDDGFISCVDHHMQPLISQEYTDENTRSGCINVMVKFCLDKSKWEKYKKAEEKLHE